MIREQILTTANNLFSSNYIFTFLTAIIIDIITGIFKGLYNKKLSSKIGLKGLIKHCCIILIVFSISVILPLIGYTTGARAIIVFYIIQYCLSIIENVGCMGVPIPPYVTKAIQQLSSKNENEEIKKDIKQ